MPIFLKLLLCLSSKVAAAPLKIWRSLNPAHRKAILLAILHGGVFFLLRPQWFMRDTRNALPCSETMPVEEVEHGCTVDFVADTGDGWDATFTVAAALVQPALLFPNVSLSRGTTLIHGGDVVYPSPSKVDMRARFQNPYKVAFHFMSHEPELQLENRPEMVFWLTQVGTLLKESLIKAIGNHPRLAPLPPRSEWSVDHKHPPELWAIPGNHDAMDGGALFEMTFVEENCLAGWVLPQEGNYWLHRSCMGWILIGISDQQAAGDDPDIDLGQLWYFQEKVSAWSKSKSKVHSAMLFMHSPFWLLNRKIGTRLLRLLEELRDLNVSLRAIIAGDLHFYAHYAPTTPHQPHLIVSGSGGAFLHSTWPLPQTLSVNLTSFGGYQLLRSYPNRFTSLSLLLDIWKLKWAWALSLTATFLLLLYFIGLQRGVGDIWAILRSYPGVAIIMALGLQNFGEMLSPFVKIPDYLVCESARTGHPAIIQAVILSFFIILVNAMLPYAWLPKLIVLLIAYIIVILMLLVGEAYTLPNFKCLTPLILVLCAWLRSIFHSPIILHASILALLFNTLLPQSALLSALQNHFIHKFPVVAILFILWAAAREVLCVVNDWLAKHQDDVVSYRRQWELRFDTRLYPMPSNGRGFFLPGLEHMAIAQRFGSTVIECLPKIVLIMVAFLLVACQLPLILVVIHNRIRFFDDILFSAAGIEQFKGFLRMRLGQNQATIYSIGIDNPFPLDLLANIASKPGLYCNDSVPGLRYVSGGGKLLEWLTTSSMMLVESYVV